MPSLYVIVQRRRGKICLKIWILIMKRPLNSIKLLAVLLPNGLQMQQIPFILQQKIVLRLDALANIVERLMSCRKNTNKLWILFQKFFSRKLDFLSLYIFIMFAKTCLFDQFHTLVTLDSGQCTTLLGSLSSLPNHSMMDFFGAEFGIY